MNEIADKLKALIADSSLVPDDEWVDAMYRQYPYFPLPSLLKLERDAGLSDDRRRELTRRVALNSSDAEALYRLVEPMSADFNSIYPDTAGVGTPSTDDAIDTFIDNYGLSDSRKRRYLKGSFLILSPTMHRFLPMRRSEICPMTVMPPAIHATA